MYHEYASGELYFHQCSKYREITPWTEIHPVAPLLPVDLRSTPEVREPASSVCAELLKRYLN